MNAPRNTILVGIAIVSALACGPTARVERAVPVIDPHPGGRGGNTGTGGTASPGTGGAGGTDTSDPIDVAPEPDLPVAEVVPEVTPEAAPEPPDVPPPPPDIARGVVGHWRFDEGMGNVLFDSSDTQNHAGVVNVMPADWRPGRRGTGLKFTPERRMFVSIPDHHSVNPTAAFSVAFWYNAASQAGSPRLVQKGETDEQYGLRIEEDELRFSVRLASGTVLRAAVAAPKTTTWVHVVATFDRRAVQLYLDGNPQGMTAGTGAGDSALATSTGNLTAGGRPAAAADSEFFAGLLDELVIYERALSPAEVKLLFTARAPP